MASLLTKIGSRNVPRHASSVSGVISTSPNRNQANAAKAAPKPAPVPVQDLSNQAVKTLFTPGPLMVSDRVKQAMMRDMGTRHSDFTYVTQCVRQSILKIAELTSDSHTVIPLSGSGTMATEAMIRTVIPLNKGKFLVMANGVYGKRIANICERSGINYEMIPVDVGVLEQEIASGNDIIGVIVVHCETSSGIINPVDEIGKIVKESKPDCLYFIDGMTTFGAVPINMMNVDFLVSTANKCLQSVPGLSFVIANKEKLQRHRGYTAGLALDLADQYDELESTGQFRFTPPTHVMLAFKEALLEYEEEGKLFERAKRYKENAAILKSGMKEMGFKQLLDDDANKDGYIVTSYLYPSNPLFSFKEFYDRLSVAGHLICSMRNNPSNCFRIGSIGNIYPEDMKDLLRSIRQVCMDMNIKLPLEETVLA